MGGVGGGRRMDRIKMNKVTELPYLARQYLARHILQGDHFYFTV